MVEVIPHEVPTVGALVEEVHGGEEDEAIHQEGVVAETLILRFLDLLIQDRNMGVPVTDILDLGVMEAMMIFGNHHTEW